MRANLDHVARRVSRFLAVAASGVLLVVSALACTPKASPRPATVTATAQTGVDHEQLVELAGVVVGGPQFLADPSTGRLPDVRAFHRAGIASLTVSDGRIRVVFLVTVSDRQRRAVVAKLATSPLVLSVVEGEVAR